MINSLVVHGDICAPDHEEYLKQFVGDFTPLDSFEAMMPPQRDWFSLGMQTEIRATVEGVMS